MAGLHLSGITSALVCEIMPHPSTLGVGGGWVSVSTHVWVCVHAQVPMNSQRRALGRESRGRTSEELHRKATRITRVRWQCLWYSACGCVSLARTICNTTAVGQDWVLLTKHTWGGRASLAAQVSPSGPSIVGVPSFQLLYKWPPVTCWSWATTGHMPSHQSKERESGDQDNFILTKLKRNYMHPYVKIHRAQLY